MRAVDLIERKRDGGVLLAEEIEFFVSAYARGDIPDYQAAALAMAVFFRGMDPAETRALTESMMRSGEVLDLSDLPGPKADKHSTGGVGDKTSLILGPLAAACGVFVPMISGRALGHTGGTLDKLESIPGFRVGLDLPRFRSVLARCGLSFIGQTPEIAPADRRLYALRDVTATVESQPLIAASIMSKKMAEGLDALVLDVKCGEGAFLRAREDARQLALTMMGIGQSMGCRVGALLTAVDQPLGRNVGNALEVAESVETLKGRGPKDLESLSVELAARMVQLARGLAVEEARAKVREALASGAGLQKLREVIEAQGGDPRVCDDPPSLLPRAPGTEVIRSTRDGRVVRLSPRAIGRAAVMLGAGRDTVDGSVDPAVGFVFHKKVGDPVAINEPIVTAHVGSRDRLDAGMAELRSAIEVGPQAPGVAPLVLEVLT